jgi:hypothetical protein
MRSPYVSGVELQAERLEHRWPALTHLSNRARAELCLISTFALL